MAPTPKLRVRYILVDRTRPNDCRPLVYERDQLPGEAPRSDLIVAAHQELTLAALLEMEVDPIIEEVRRIRQEYAKRFGYDLCAVAADVRRREQQHPGRLVSFPPRPVREKRTV